LTEDWTSEQREAFARDDFLIVEEGFIDGETVELLRERFDRLFAGDYVTGIRPDEVNWVAGRDPEDRTRQICNGWKANPTGSRRSTERCPKGRRPARADRGQGRAVPRSTTTTPSTARARTPRKSTAGR
jgi:hypothetical protein